MLTFEQVDKQISGSSVASKAAPSAKLNAVQTLGKIWNGGAKAIVSFSLLIFPKKWQTVINKLIQVIDIIVAQEEIPALPEIE